MPKNPVSKNGSSNNKNSVLLKLISSLWREEDAQPFQYPVNFKELNLFDYPKFIKNPMDLSTLRRNVKNNKYKNYDQFFEDLNLIWTNCKIYNLEGSEIYAKADRMEKAAKRILSNLSKKKISKRKNSNFLHRTNRKQIKKEEPLVNLNQKNDNRDQIDEEKSFKDKIKICQILKKLNQEQLIEVIKIIERNNRNAIEVISEDKFHIKIEEVTSGTMTRIFTYFDKIQITEKENNYIS